MPLDVAALSGRQAYDLLIDCVVPRPVAWILTLDPEGIPNLAPFSFFNAATARPPTISVAVSAKPSEAGFVAKDTVRNLLHHGAFVVHLATALDAGAVSRSAEDFPAGTDVPAHLGLDLLPGAFGPIPRLAGAPVALELEWGLAGGDA